LSVDPEDVNSARELSIKLKEDKDFYNHCSNISKELYNKNYFVDIWKKKMTDILKNKL